MWPDVDLQQGQPIRQDNIRGYRNTLLPLFHSQWHIAMDLVTLKYLIFSVIEKYLMFSIFTQNIGTFWDWGKQLIVSYAGTVGQ